MIRRVRVNLVDGTVLWLSGDDARELHGGHLRLNVTDFGSPHLDRRLRLRFPRQVTVWAAAVVMTEVIEGDWDA